MPTKPKPTTPRKQGPKLPKANGVKLIAQERDRQISKEKWTPSHDDKHTQGELSVAAGCYAEAATFRTCRLPMRIVNETPNEWPWEYQWWKPTRDPVGNLVKAGALIAAEIDRIQRIGFGGNPA